MQKVKDFHLAQSEFTHSHHVSTLHNAVEAINIYLMKGVFLTGV